MVLFICNDYNTLPNVVHFPNFKIKYYNSDILLVLRMLNNFIPVNFTLIKIDRITTFDTQGLFNL